MYERLSELRHVQMAGKLSEIFANLSCLMEEFIKCYYYVLISKLEKRFGLTKEGFPALLFDSCS